jgi:UDP-2,4-diacetamido-2,4,6-trideoxy-beta-L-altropyranose hydrolase
MRVLFRADASTEIGTGHVVRCLTLADCLRRRGAEVTFVTEDLPGNIDAQIRSGGFNVQRRVAEDCDWLVVDHYALGASYEREQKAFAGKVFVIDDLANRPHDCDLLLDQNLVSNMEARYRPLVPESTRLLVGPDFALLRSEFAAAREHSRPRERLRRILVFFGGSDPTDETSKTLRALRAAELPDVSIEALVGASNPRRTQVESLARQVRNCTVSGPTQQIAALFSAVDLSIGAGGTTTWERCCLGLPALVIAVAANQDALSRSVAERGFHRYLGTSDAIDEASLVEAITMARDQFSDLAVNAFKATTLVDGLGAERVCAAMLGPSPPAHVRLRRAALGDASLLLAWRNDPATRAASHNDARVSDEDHESWLAKTIANPGRRLFIAELDGQAVGTVRADEGDGEWTLSWTVAPDARGRGVAKHMVSMLASQLREPIRAEVKADNFASARIAEYAGMHFRSESNGVRIFSRPTTK